MHSFAVVDIETTGLWQQGHSITELSVVHSDGHTAREVLHSMVNPGRDIPRQVQALTGIDAGMVAAAPPITELLAPLREALEGRIFVAHMAAFDYSFIKALLHTAKQPFQPRKLCTVRAAKAVLPALPSYKLPYLCQHLGIAATGFHRAGADAMATAELLHRLLAADDAGAIEALLHGRTPGKTLPPHLLPEEFHALPQQPGVYYLKGQHGHTLYVGKANNIQQRVASHFTGAGASARKQLLHRLVHHVTYRRTHHEYMALLLEDAEIQRLKPPFNVAQKQKPGAHSVTLYTDRSGYVRPAVVPSAGLSTAVASFSSRHQAHSWLLSHLLQSDMPYLVPGSEHPWPTPEVHRSRMSTFAERLTPAYPTPTLLLCPTGESDVPFALFQNGCCAGMGYAPHTATPGNLYLDYMHPTPDTATARMVVQRMYQDPEIVKVPLTPTL